MSMKYKNVCLLISLFLLQICIAEANGPTDASDVNYSVAVMKNTSTTKTVTKYVPVPVRGQLMSVSGSKSSTSKDRLIGQDAVLAANKKALRQANSRNYINSIMTFDYMDGALYQIYAAPLKVTDIQFQPNEHIVSVGAGDTLRWQVSRTYSGSSGGREEHLLVKPTDEDLENSLVITTDQRTYHLNLKSTAGTYMASVAWRYPSSDGLLQNIGDDGGANSAASGIGSGGLDLNHLDFNYTYKIINSRTPPTWMPQSIFNDGSKTFIKFPAQMQEAPTLFVGTSAKNDQIVNYRVDGNFYIVDRVITQAQLRSGNPSDPAVQISHR